MSRGLVSWFKCYPDDFLYGLRDLESSDQITFYTVLVMRNYDAGDAVWSNLKTIGKWCHSNAGKARRVIGELIEMGRIEAISDGVILDTNAFILAEKNGQKIGFIDVRALETMLEFCAENSNVSHKYLETIAKLSQMFCETNPKHIEKCLEKLNKNNGPLLEEDTDIDKDINPPNPPCEGGLPFDEFKNRWGQSFPGDNLEKAKIYWPDKPIEQQHAIDGIFYQRSAVEGGAARIGPRAYLKDKIFNQYGSKVVRLRSGARVDELGCIVEEGTGL